MRTIWITTKEAAELSGAPLSKIREWCRSGWVRARKKAPEHFPNLRKIWHIDRQDLLDFMDERGTDGYDGIWCPSCKFFYAAELDCCPVCGNCRKDFEAVSVGRGVLYDDSLPRNSNPLL